MCRGHRRTLSRTWFSLLSCGFRSLTSALEAWGQAPLPRSPQYSVCHTFLPSLSLSGHRCSFINLRVRHWAALPLTDLSTQAFVPFSRWPQMEPRVSVPCLLDLLCSPWVWAETIYSITLVWALVMFFQQGYLGRIPRFGHINPPLLKSRWSTLWWGTRPLGQSPCSCCRSPCTQNLTPRCACCRNGRGFPGQAAGTPAPLPQALCRHSASPSPCAWEPGLPVRVAWGTSWNCVTPSLSLCPVYPGKFFSWVTISQVFIETSNIKNLLNRDGLR